MVQARCCACATHSTSVLGPVAGLGCARPDTAPKSFSCSTLWMTAWLFLYLTQQHSSLGVTRPRLTRSCPWQVHPLLSLCEEGSTNSLEISRGVQLLGKHKFPSPSHTSVGKGREYQLAKRGISEPCLKGRGTTFCRTSMSSEKVS